jgi:hypothetical protein
MKIVSDKFFAFIIFLFGITSVLAGAKQTPPEPMQAQGIDPPPGDAPINDGIYVLLVVAILFGLYIIYSDKTKTETSV